MLFFNCRVDVSSKNHLKKFKEGEDEIISGDVLKKKLESQYVMKALII